MLCSKLVQRAAGRLAFTLALGQRASVSTRIYLEENMVMSVANVISTYRIGMLPCVIPYSNRTLDVV